MSTRYKSQWHMGHELPVKCRIWTTMGVIKRILDPYVHIVGPHTNFDHAVYSAFKVWLTLWHFKSGCSFSMQHLGIPHSIRVVPVGRLVVKWYNAHVHGQLLGMASTSARAFYMQINFPQKGHTWKWSMLPRHDPWVVCPILIWFTSLTIQYNE